MFVAVGKFDKHSITIAFSARYPNLKSVRELVYKRGFAKVNGCRIGITDNSIIENKLGVSPLFCFTASANSIYVVLNLQTVVHKNYLYIK